MNDSTPQLIQKRLVVAQLLILLNCYFCFTYIYESVLIYISWVLGPIAMVLWLSTKPWKSFTLNYITYLQIALYIWISIVTIIHRDTSINSQMLLLGFLLFFLVSNTMGNDDATKISSLLIISEVVILTTGYSIAGLVAGWVNPDRFARIGVSTHPNHFGAFCFIGLATEIGLYHFWGRKQPSIIKICMGLAFLVNLTALFYSDSRAAFLGIITFVLCYSLFMGVCRIKNKKLGRIVIVSIVCIAVVSLIWYVFHRGYTFSDTESSYSILDKLSSGRFELWKAGISVITDHPLIGLSNQNYGEIIAQFRGEGYGQHNIILGIGVYYGLPGILLLLVLIVGTIAAAVRVYKKKDQDTEKKDYIVFWSIFFVALLMNDMFETYIIFLHMPNSFLFFFSIGVIGQFFQSTKKAHV